MDHENYEIYHSNGTLYGNCEKKAVNIRQIGSHILWHSLKDNPLVFSNLSDTTFLRIVEEKDRFNGTIPKIKYTKAVNSKYGYAEYLMA